MKTITDAISIIDKGMIETLEFPKQEVLLDAEQIEHRRIESLRAMKLGNSFKDKIRIIFEDAEGIKVVETTVWGVMDGYLIFKRGMLLPLHRVYEIII